MLDAVVIGAGPNGLVAANILADSGWDVTVLEAQERPGGAVRTEELVEPGFRNDVFSAFYPMAAASPVIRELELERYGLRWRRAPLVVAHPLLDGRCASLSTDLDETAASVESFAAGDGEAWRRLYALWERVGDHLVEALLRPFPPVRPGARLAAALGPADLLRFVRMGLLPVRRLAKERFAGEGAPLLLAGNALHSDLTPESAGGAMFGWLLCMLGQQVGFPVPEGGAGGLTDALVRRLEAHGGRVETGARVARVLVRRGRAEGVRTADGREVRARRAVLADVSAPSLFLELVGPEHLSAPVVEDVRRFEWDVATFKVDWTLDGPIPWTAEEARRAGTVHVGEGFDALSEHSSYLSRGVVSDHPFLVTGQYARADETRAPEGRETAWAYTHVPQQVRGDARGELADLGDPDDVERFADRIEEEMEARAPGFRALVRGRHLMGPGGLEARDENLVGGALNGGTAQLHQELLFRPIPGLAQPETPIRRLYLASASAHPGGSVHGAAGANAANAARGRARRLVHMAVTGMAGRSRSKAKSGI